MGRYTVTISALFTVTAESEGHAERLVADGLVPDFVHVLHVSEEPWLIGDDTDVGVSEVEEY